MDNADILNYLGVDPNRPVPTDNELNKPIPFDDDTNSVSSPTPPKPPTTSIPAKAVQPTQAVTADKGKTTSSNRITGVKTFFTKLHPGALEFLDQQINDWLKVNPGIAIKQTNTVTGEIQGKKTEPNIIITVWY